MTDLMLSTTMIAPKAIYPAPSVDEDLMAQLGRDQNAFFALFERHYQRVYSYFAVHTCGDLTRSAEMTAQTFCQILFSYRSFERSSFSSWLFGIAWDVLNHHNRQAGLSVNLPAEPFKTQKLGPNHAELMRVLNVLRSFPFYQREALYLRFFAVVPPKDIGILMDRNETTVKTLVCQAAVDLTSKLFEPVKEPVSKEIAEDYERYLAAFLSDTTSDHSMPVYLIYATNRLKALRESVTVQPELYKNILDHLQQLIRMRASAGKRL
jgi:DNA-directed RNA polymerase specialized sigma24 family protein